MYWKEEIIEYYKKELKILYPDLTDFDLFIEYPKDRAFGDVSLPFFSLAKILKMSPSVIAEEVKNQCPNYPYVEKTSAISGYLNLTLKPSYYFQIIGSQKTKPESNKTQKVSIEFCSPNTNKPLHIGHLRNIALGESLASLFEASGSEVIKTEVVNDRGIAIAKMMLIYERFHKDEEPNKKTDHYAGELYIEFEKRSLENPNLELEAQEILRLWENGDSYWFDIWEKLRGWVIIGQEETYQKLQTFFHERIFESDIYKEGKDIVQKAYSEGLLYRDAESGFIYANLESENLPNKILLRSNGTSLYITQDLALLERRLKGDSLCANSNILIYITAFEQNLQFAQLFAIAKQLGIVQQGLYHVGYGAIRLPEGKMSSRKGNVIHIDSLIEDIEQVVRETHFDGSDLPESEKMNRVSIIARAAYWYYVIATTAKKDMVFDRNTAVAITGKTGPYILYTYARLKSVLRKSNMRPKFQEDYKFETERELLNYLIRYPDAIESATRELDPGILAQYLFDIAELSNSYYHSNPIIGNHNEASRLLVIELLADTIQNGLSLLKIPTLEEM